MGNVLLFWCRTLRPFLGFVNTADKPIGDEGIRVRETTVSRTELVSTALFGLLLRLSAASFTRYRVNLSQFTGIFSPLTLYEVSLYAELFMRCVEEAG